MNDDTTCLLKECNAGCKMAINSMNQVQEFIEDDELKHEIDTYKKTHEDVEKQTSRILEQAGCTEKEPNKMASMFSWITSEMKLMMRDDAHQAAKIMMDGCNMGIQSISEYQNKYTQASDEAKSIADKLIHQEEVFMDKLKKYM